MAQTSVFHSIIVVSLTCTFSYKAAFSTLWLLAQIIRAKRIALFANFGNSNNFFASSFSDT
jgi:hypothetical protein